MQVFVEATPVITTHAIDFENIKDYFIKNRGEGCYYTFFFAENTGRQDEIRITKIDRDLSFPDIQASCISHPVIGEP